DVLIRSAWASTGFIFCPFLIGGEAGGFEESLAHPIANSNSDATIVVFISPPWYDALYCNRFQRGVHESSHFINVLNGFWRIGSAKGRHRQPGIVGKKSER